MSSLTCTLIQTSLLWEDKQANRNKLQAKIESIDQPTEVVILPEMFTTGFSMKPELFAESMEGETVQWMKDLSARRRIILAGSIMIQEGDHYYNRLIWMLPNGQFGYYDKRHLFAYGNEHEHYTPGAKRFIASVKGWKISLNICYDLRFPVWARQQPADGATAEYDLLVYVANWPERRNTAWKSLLQARAIENQCFCIGVNRVGNDGNNIYYSGDSMIVHPLGEIIYHKEHDEDICTMTLHKVSVDEVRERMPFWKDADPFKILQW